MGLPRSAFIALLVTLMAAPRAEATDSSGPAEIVSLPPPPDAPVAFTLADLLPDAIARHLGDPQFQIHPKLPRKEREAIAAFYALGGFKPLWIGGEGTWTPAARALIAQIRKAEEDGLEASDYPIPVPPEPTRGQAAAEIAAAELRLSATAVQYARDARGARIEPARLSRLITPKLDLPSGDAVLTRIAAAADPGAALASYQPPHSGYLALKAKLADVRSGKAPAGEGSRSLSQLEGDIIANMERWRWLPADLGRRHVWVNVPEFKLRLVENGRPIHEARVIVGKPETPTPIFSDEMDHAVVNPSWYVPPSIFRNEFHSDPALAAARGYEVRRTKDGGWSIRQPPGERNALGFIKFMFPNQHSVYLHDTPNRNLFSAERRAFSHGCVRLDQPFRFADFVLGAEWTEARLKSLIGKGERTIRLPEKIPVHLTYFTLAVGNRGELTRVADLYAFNNKVRVALGLPSDGTAVAQTAPKATEATRVRTAARRAPPRRAQAAVRYAYPPPYPYYTPYTPSYFWWVTR